jgi:hypothetical protein
VNASGCCCCYKSSSIIIGKSDEDDFIPENFASVIVVFDKLVLYPIILCKDEFVVLWVELEKARHKELSIESAMAFQTREMDYGAQGDVKTNLLVKTWCC